MIQVRGQFNDVKNFKLAYPAPLFLDLGIVDQELRGFLQNTVAVGHNRHATKGASDKHENAHPFEHGHISLVHNGSLTSHFNISHGQQFTVDSEAICYSIMREGAAETIPKLNGAFALVWVDSNEQTLNFVRNEERPMAIAMNTKTNKMWWASEMDMLKWSLNRDTFTRNPVVYDKIFELPVGKWLKIPITRTGIDLEGLTFEEVKVHEPYVYTSYVGGYNRTAGKQTTSTVKSPARSTSVNLLEQKATSGPVAGETVTEYEFGKQREEAMKQITEKLIAQRGRDHCLIRSFVASLDLSKEGLVIDDRVGVFLSDWAPYTKDSKVGTANGITMEYPYCKVAIHSVTCEEYQMWLDDYIAMITSYVSGINAAPGASVNNMGDDVMSDFTLILRKDQVRRADLDAFSWSMDHIPEDIKETPSEPKEYTSLTEDDDYINLIGQLQELEEAEDTDRVAVLKDDSRVNPSGTAVYLGPTNGDLVSNLRYSIVGIFRQEKEVFLTAKVSGKTYDVLFEHWGQGNIGEPVSVGKIDVVKQQATG